MRKLKLLGVIAVVAFGLVGIAGCGKEKVDLNEYVSLGFSGVDTEGTVSVDFDYDKFEQDLSKMWGADKVKDEEEAWDLAWELLEKAEEAEDCVEFNVEPSTNLKNGDKVVLKAEIDEAKAEELDLKFHFKEIKETVSGLEEAVIISEEELFKDVIVEYVGASPAAEVQIRNTSSDEYISQINFVADKTSGLKEGDVITVTAEEATLSDQVILKETSKEYEVKDVDKYITSLGQLSDEHMKKIMGQAADMIEANLEGKTLYKNLYKGDEEAGELHDVEKNSDTKLTTSYFSTLKDGLDREWGECYNRLDITYTFNVTQIEKYFSKYDYSNCYIAIQCEDIILTKDGELQFDIDTMEFTDGYTTKDTFYQKNITPTKARNVVEEVDLTKYQ